VTRRLLLVHSSFDSFHRSVLAIREAVRQMAASQHEKLPQSRLQRAKRLRVVADVSPPKTRLNQAEAVLVCP